MTSPNDSQRLERLVVSPFNYASDLRIIQNYCPNLRVIGTQNRVGDLPATSDHDNTPTPGVRTFHVQDNENHWLNEDHGYMDHVMEFMQRNSDTLQDVSFYASFPFNQRFEDVADFDTSNPPLFNRMTSYSQEIDTLQHEIMASMVAQQSPHLKKFELVSTGNEETDVGVFFDELIGRCKLEEAIVRLPCRDELGDAEGIERFIQYHSTIDSQLHTLILPQGLYVSSHALDSLIALPRLKALGFDWLWC